MANEFQPSTHTRPLWRNVGLLVGFVALVVVGVLTVLLPELRDEPESGSEPESTAEPAEP